LVAGIFWVSGANAADQDLTIQKKAAARVPLNDVPKEMRERVRQVLEQPTLYSRGPTEAFTGKPDF
jgi:hypothetical protein